MVASPLKKMTHSRSSSKNSNNNVSRELSSNLRKNGMGPQPQAQTKEQRITSMDLARQYDSDRTKIIRCCFNRRDADGQLHENYITHVRIVEDSHHPSSRPPPNANPSHKKQRFLMMSVKRTGRVRLHKGRENQDGSVQIGRTWDLDELSRLEKDLDNPVGFILHLGKTYYWETSSAKEVIVFNTSVISTYMKYTSKIPELVNWDLKAMGLTPPPTSTSARTGAGARQGPTHPAQSDAALSNKSNTAVPSALPPTQPLQMTKTRPVAQHMIGKANTSGAGSATAIGTESSKSIPMDIKRPLQIDPPSQNKFVPNRNVVLGNGSTTMPSSRIAAPAASSQTSIAGSGQSVGAITQDSIVSNSSEKVATVSSTSSKTNFDLYGALKKSVPSSGGVIEPVSSATRSIKNIPFNANTTSFAEVEKETDDSNDMIEDDDDDEDDIHDVTNYYRDDASAEQASVDREEESTSKGLGIISDMNPKIARYSSKQLNSSVKDQEAEAFADELISNINRSVADDISTLQRKLTRQLVISANESCQALINLGDGNIALKDSLDSCLSQCEKLAPSMAFFNVELASFKEEISHINKKADFIGLTNRNRLYNELSSSLT